MADQARGAEASNLIVHGTACTWWDSLDKAGQRMLADGGDGVVVLACPHCGGNLTQPVTEQAWTASMAQYEACGIADYRVLMAWGRGRCFSDTTALLDAWLAEHPKGGGESTHDRTIDTTDLLFEGMPEDFAAEIVRRWNAFRTLSVMAHGLDARLTNDHPNGPDQAEAVIGSETAEAWAAYQAMQTGPAGKGRA